MTRVTLFVRTQGKETPITLSELPGGWASETLQANPDAGLMSVFSPEPPSRSKVSYAWKIVRRDSSLWLIGNEYVDGGQTMLSPYVTRCMFYGRIDFSRLPRITATTNYEEVLDATLDGHPYPGPYPG